MEEESVMTEQPPRLYERLRRRLHVRPKPNPLLVKELRGRMRGARAFVVLTVYLLLLSCVTVIIYYAYSASSRSVGGGLEIAYLGKTIFATIIFIQIFTVAAIAPSLTSGSISGERERKTYELLRTTLLSAPQLILGKLFSALAYTVLLILVAVPLASLAFMLGGVVMEELILAVIILLVTAFAFAAIGLFFSSFVRSTRVSSTLTYVTTLLLTIGLPILMGVVATLLGPLTYSSSTSWLMEVVMLYALYIVAGFSPITTAIFTEIALESEDTIWFFWTSVNGSRYLIPVAWVVYIVVYLILALVLLLISILRIRRQARQ